MNQPTTPFFLFDRGKHFIDLHDITDLGKSVSRLALVTGWDSRSIVYDSQGAAWRFRFDNSKEQFSSLDKLLAQLYNPVRPTSITWHQQQAYPLSELKNAFLDALEHDDDILTQFVERRELGKRIEQSATFSELVETWRWMKTDQD